MCAVFAKGPGPPEVVSVVDLSDPEPASGQVVVAVDVVAVSDIDTQPRAGRARSAGASSPGSDRVGDTCPTGPAMAALKPECCT